MGYKYSFMDNEIYGAEDINAAVSRLTTSGVTVCPTDENLISAMNTVTAGMITDGVEYNANSCRVIRTEAGELKIESGTAFFENGVSIVIDEEGIILPMEEGVYVYLYHDIESNSCYAETAAALPAERYILLANVMDTGEIKDMRKYAQSRMAPNSPQSYIEFSKDYVLSYTNKLLEYTLDTINVGHPNYTHVALRNPEENVVGWGKFNEDGFTDYIYVKREQDVACKFERCGNMIRIHVRRNYVGSIGVSLSLTVL